MIFKALSFGDVLAASTGQAVACILSIPRPSGYRVFTVHSVRGQLAASRADPRFFFPTNRPFCTWGRVACSCCERQKTQRRTCESKKQTRPKLAPSGTYIPSRLFQSAPVVLKRSIGRSPEDQQVPLLGSPPDGVGFDRLPGPAAQRCSWGGKLRSLRLQVE